MTLGGCWPFGGDQSAASKQTAEAIRETLIITATEAGTVEAEEKVIIANELKWSVIIKKLVEEGTVVKEGDLIVEFESKKLEDAIDAKELAINNADLTLEQANKQLIMAEKQQAINLEQAKNAVQDAEENQAVYEEQSKSLIAQQKDILKRAEESLTRFNSKGGQRENDLRNADITIDMTEKQLKIAKKKLDFKNKVNANPKLNKPYSESEIESDKLALENLKNTLEKAIAARKLLKTYEIPQLVRQLEENIKQAKEDLKILETHTVVQKTRKNTTALKEAKLKLEQAKLGQEAELKWKKQEIKGLEKALDEHKEQMTELREDEDKLKVTAERAGLVLYDPGWKREGQRLQVKEGEEIYPRGKLMQIPDMTTLRVQTMVFEALREYVTVEEDDTPAATKIETYVGKGVRSIMVRSRLNKWSKEKIAAKFLKLKEDETVPRITKAVRIGKMTKAEAQAFYARLEEKEAELAKKMGLDISPFKIEWDQLSEAPPKKAASRPGDKEGTRAILVLDSFAKKTQIIGRVVESSPLPKNTGPHWLKTGTKAYDLYIGVDWEAHGLTPGENLRPGMGGKVTLVLDEIENALTIPVLSVYNQRDKYFCMKIDGGNAVETQVEIGKMNDSRVQILSGLKEGDKVLLVAQSDEGANGEDEDEDKTSSDNGGAKASE
jgi:multidrug efflux pump subunit AcrA (membrane-fusion protein)